MFERKRCPCYAGGEFWVDSLWYSDLSKPVDVPSSHLAGTRTDMNNEGVLQEAV